MVRTGPKPSPSGKDAAHKKRTRISQKDVPHCSVEEALRVPKAIAEHYAYGPTTPLEVADALQIQPTSGGFRMLCGAASAYGLTKGGYNSQEISIEGLGMRIVRPLKEGDDRQAKREAFLTPRVVGEFLKKYSSAAIPRKDIAYNVLIQMGVPKERAKSVLDLILTGAESLGFFRTIKGKKYVHLTLQGLEEGKGIVEGAAAETQEPSQEKKPEEEGGPPPSDGRAGAQEAEQRQRKRRVYISHGKNKSLVDTIKKLLTFGEMEAVVSVERQSVSQPVSDKVMDEMRSCGAAIIHIDAEQKLIDQDAKEHLIVNPNVLIEIGAAMALYGRRFILLVKEEVKLPLNLQGLYEVGYGADTLDGDATIKLLEAINDIKNHPLPPISPISST